MRLLLAEDDDKLRKELGKFFSMHGYETEEITDYEHMEEEILKARGQLLLLDMNLPFWMESICAASFVRRLPFL